MAFRDVAVDFTQDEWVLLSPAQRSLGTGGDAENYSNLVSLGKPARSQDPGPGCWQLGAASWFLAQPLGWTPKQRHFVNVYSVYACVWYSAFLAFSRRGSLVSMASLPNQYFVNEGGTFPHSMRSGQWTPILASLSLAGSSPPQIFLPPLGNPRPWCGSECRITCDHLVLFSSEQAFSFLKPKLITQLGAREGELERREGMPRHSCLGEWGHWVVQEGWGWGGLSAGLWSATGVHCPSRPAAALELPVSSASAIGSAALPHLVLSHYIVCGFCYYIFKRIFSLD